MGFMEDKIRLLVVLASLYALHMDFIHLLRPVYHATLSDLVGTQLGFRVLLKLNGLQIFSQTKLRE